MPRKYSRRALVEEKRNKRKAAVFVLLSFFSLALFFVYGLPLTIKYAGVIGGIARSDLPAEKGDTTPPPSPTLDMLPQNSQNDTVDINGSTEPGAQVFLLINGKKEQVISNNSGRFSFSVKLREGENKFYLYAQDKNGNKSPDTSEFVIIYDDEPPEVEVISPSDGQKFYGEKGKSVKIEGYTEREAKVIINSKYAIVDASGRFAHAVSLSEGKNEFKVKAEDLAGNASEKTISVYYAP